MDEGIQNHAEGGRPSLPVHLQIEGQSCLVVGGGPVAHRKAMGLLAAGARVRVVSPTLCPDLAALAAARRITHELRCFAAQDVHGMRLVFAATNDRATNRRILEATRAAGALCCCVDGNWTAGDFITPAVLQRDGLTLTVSTGGRSCRQSRLVKDTLGRHIRSIETADLLILGTSHEQLSLERREAVQRVGANLNRAGDMLMHVWGIHEFMLLSTCNRFELAAIASASACRSGLPDRILGFDGLGEHERYQRTGAAAFEHMALVTAGMQSQSPGEYHVASQVKAAMQTARERGWANSLLQAWVAEALHMSKHIKNEVAPLLPPAEIEDRSIDYADERKGGDWRGHTVLVLGAGMLGRSLVEKTVARAGRCLWAYRSRRPTLPPEWKDRVRLISTTALPLELGRCDLLFCAAQSPDPVLREEHASAFDPKRPLLILDLGVPRNVSPTLMSLLPRAELVNLDRLKAWAVRRDGSLERAMALSRDIVEQHGDRYAALLTRFQGRNKTQ